MIGQISGYSANNDLAPGFSLIGLFPIGVGLAYLLSYRAETRKHTIST